MNQKYNSRTPSNLEDAKRLWTHQNMIKPGLPPDVKYLNHDHELKELFKLDEEAAQKM